MADEPTLYTVTFTEYEIIGLEELVTREKIRVDRMMDNPRMRWDSMADYRRRVSNLQAKLRDAYSITRSRGT